MTAPTALPPATDAPPSHGDPRVAAGSRSRTALLTSPRVLRVMSVVVVLGAWELVGRADPRYMSYPSAIARAGREVLVEDGRLREAFRTTLWGFTVGYVVAAAIGLVIGFLMGRSAVVDIALRPYVNAFYSTPRIALIPLLVLFAGIGFRLRLSIVVLSAVFPIIITVRDGAKAVSQEYLDVSRIFVASRLQTWRTAILPGSLPFVFAALRIGAQRAMIGIIVAETMAALTGTGRVIREYGQFSQTDRLLVPVIVIGLFSITLTAVINAIHALAAPWDRRRRTRR